MAKRFVAIWFRHLTTDRLIRYRPALKDQPFVLAATERGRMMVKAANTIAASKGIRTGMVIADCRALLPALQVFDDTPWLEEKLLKAFAEWCIRYTPIAAIDPPDGLILDISGCAHLWGGERFYLNDLLTKLRGFGYDVRGAMADTIGTAWAIARYGTMQPIIRPNDQTAALMPLPAAALRLDPAVLGRLEKLGLYHIHSFMNMPRSVLRRRFGQLLLTRLDQALGKETEPIDPVCPIEPYQERLPAMDAIRTVTGIEIALKHLLGKLCKRLLQEGNGLRKAVFKGYRADKNVQQMEIGTHRPSRNPEHLFGLFELRINTLAPGLGFELFILEALHVEPVSIEQEALWQINENNDEEIAALLDRIAAKTGNDPIHRYLPDEHYWPERSIKPAISLHEQPATYWRTDRLRPVHLLAKPEPIEVSVPIPDYPPMLFRYRGQVHPIKKADGPERIEQEWWLAQGEHRDYYCVEDEQGARYWLFRLGHYATGEPQWFIHGFFA